MGSQVVEAATFSALNVPELECRVAADLLAISKRVRQELGDTLLALILGGGYGRGEGGGQQDVTGRWHPTNDYDLVALVRSISPWRLGALRRRLASLGSKLETDLGIEVELSPLPLEKLPHLPFTLMWCELLAGHCIVTGDPGALAAAPVLPPGHLPLIEGIRYLTNRAALLLWASLESLPADRTLKFVHKAWLASGAVVLIASGRFCAGYAAREQALMALPTEDLPSVPNLITRHAQATAARLRPPSTPAPESLVSALEEVRSGLLDVWFWFERRRIGRPFGDWIAYSQQRNLFGARASGTMTQLPRHMNILGWRGVVPWWCLADHPRTRVTRVLPALLHGTTLPRSTATLVGRGRNWEEQARSCLELWKRAN